MSRVWFCATLLVSSVASGDGLLDEVYTHPLDAFTAQTLHAGEVLYAQPPFPVPGWAEVGITDRVTIEIDMTPLIGGLFVDPHLPVPSENVRVQLFDGGRQWPSVAVEVMGQYLWNLYDQEDLDHLLVRRKGLGGFAHVNASVPIGEHSWIHASVGASYQHYYVVENVDRDTSHAGVFHDHVDPDASLSIDWRVRRWISLHATGSYGSTFVYSDNEPRKWQLGYGMRIAPLLGSSWAVLRDLRLELVALVMDRPDAKEVVALYVPILPYAYWQWRF
ncbi:MAG: hypothetical protein QM831_34750 [Kofleriaceae bacterium]